jgi:uncharacterized membrane protein YhhN
MPVLRNSNILAGLAIAAAGQSVAAHLAHYQPFIYIFKPLPILFLLTLAIYNWSRTRQSLALWICLGLLFSLAGDIFLIAPGKYFVPGLAAFLLALLCYIVAFTRDAKFPAHGLIWLIFLGLAATNFFLLKSNLPASLGLPVAIYALALSTMTAQAIGRFLLLRTSAAKLAATGAVSFLISDTLLAWDRFHAALLFAPAFILIPYYLAQLLIALSTRPPDAP